MRCVDLYNAQEGWGAAPAVEGPIAAPGPASTLPDLSSAEPSPGSATEPTHVRSNSSEQPTGDELETTPSLRQSARSVTRAAADLVSLPTSEGSFSSSQSGHARRGTPDSDELRVIRLLERKGAGQLRRFRLPPAALFAATGDGCARPALLLSAAAQVELAEAVLCLLRVLPRASDPAAIASRLPPLLRLLAEEPRRRGAAGAPGSGRGPSFAAGLRAALLALVGASPLLPVALLLHDAAGDSLLALLAAGDAEASEDAAWFETQVLRVVATPGRCDADRILAVRWVHARFAARQEAAREGDGPDCPGASPGRPGARAPDQRCALTTNWALLLPFAPDSPAVFSTRARAVAAALEAGLGDAWHAVTAVVAWQGFGEAAASPAAIKRATAARYALRVLRAAAAARPDLAAALDAAAVHGAVTRPEGTGLLLEGAALELLPAEVDAACRDPAAAFPCLAAPAVPRDWKERGALAFSGAAGLLSRAGKNARRGVKGVTKALHAVQTTALSKLERSGDAEELQSVGSGSPKCASELSCASSGLSARLLGAASALLEPVGSATLLSAASGLISAPETPPDERLRDRAFCERQLAGLSGGAPLPIPAKPVPGAGWATNAATWHAVAGVAAGADPLAQRRLILAAGVPATALRWLAAYFAVYRGQTKAHALSAREAGAAALALAHAALLRLGEGEGAEDGLTPALEALLCALGERFPDRRVRERAQCLLALLRERPDDLSRGIAQWYISAAMAAALTFLERRESMRFNECGPFLPARPVPER
ncbi:hypothetical protein QBZ16_000695 [Prototheca wickerhamii]|uniref:Uncharacterized protein n=1 Tax=Prototheca wickerhamii TaxID=3111 RepID=A0AAD9ILT7_PROWI|nr:hypothetical protein QBZ16_000695 [Prototheca wickerhamii]